MSKAKGGASSSAFLRPVEVPPVNKNIDPITKYNYLKGAIKVIQENIGAGITDNLEAFVLLGQSKKMIKGLAGKAFMLKCTLCQGCAYRDPERRCDFFDEAKPVNDAGKLRLNCYE